MIWPQPPEQLSGFGFGIPDRGSGSLTARVLPRITPSSVGFGAPTSVGYARSRLRPTLHWQPRSSGSGTATIRLRRPQRESIIDSQEVTLDIAPANAAATRPRGFSTGARQAQVKTAIARPAVG